MDYQWKVTKAETPENLEECLNGYTKQGFEVTHILASAKPGETIVVARKEVAPKSRNREW